MPASDRDPDLRRRYCDRDPRALVHQRNATGVSRVADHVRVHGAEVDRDHRRLTTDATVATAITTAEVGEGGTVIKTAVPIEGWIDRIGVQHLRASCK